MKPAPADPSDRERFLAAVAEHVPVDRVVELYLFQPIRQGGVESGIAVIAAAGDAPTLSGESVQSDPAFSESAGRATTTSEPESPEVPAKAAAIPQANGDAPPRTGEERAEPRYTVFTARYRHVLKGPERGRWEVSVVAEAEAPLATVGAVVRGVQRRAGDVEPAEHMTGDELRGALGQRGSVTDN
ncbi:MAG: hypothetical protein ABR499_18740 [Gemmatimonadaceae bacterium]